MPASSATMTRFESRATLPSMPVPTNGDSADEQRHALALHVRAHERAVRVVVLEERDQARGDGNELLRRHVHVVDLGGLDFEEVAPVADGDLRPGEMAFAVDRRVGLGDDDSSPPGRRSDNRSGR